MQAKKPLALLLSLSMGLSMGTPALAARAAKLPDVSQSWAADSIHRWLEAGLVEGDDNGLFRPAAQLTRGELATIFVRLLGLTKKAPNRYTDLKGDEWYADAILKCTAAGILQGDGARCNATQTISRQETMVMFARAMGVRQERRPDLSQFADGASAASWSAGYLAPLVELGIPPLAAHMFVFYFGIVADITPLVGLAAIAGAGIAGASTIKTGLNASRLGISAYVAPYVFVLNPVLLLINTQNWSTPVFVFMILEAAIITIVGMVCLAMGLSGYCVMPCNVIERFILIAGGIFMVIPSAWSDILGIAILVIMLVQQTIRKRKTPVAANRS